MKTWNEQVKALRVSRGMTHAQFGALLGVSERCVYHWEKGRTRMPHRAEVREALTDLGIDLTAVPRPYLRSRDPSSPAPRATAPWWKQLRAMRLARGLTVLEAAAVMGVSDTSITSWEGGATTPKSASIQALADFGVEYREGELVEVPAWARRLRRARLERGLTQREAATIIGVDHCTVSGWEVGHERHPHPSTIAGLIALGLPRSLLRVRRSATPPNGGRPTKRSECPEPDEDGTRRCPWMSCRYHLGVVRMSQRHGIRVQPEGSPYLYACTWDVIEDRSDHPSRPRPSLGHSMSLDAVGEVLGGISRERVRQIEAEALAKLRERAPWLLEHLASSPSRGRKRGSKSRVGRAA